MGIWRNIGKIVNLLGEIVYLEIKWYVRSWKSTKKSNTLKEKKTVYLSEEEESIERSKIMLDYYDYGEYEFIEDIHQKK